MNTHEYQAKQVLEEYGIRPPPFAVVSSLDEVEKAVDRMGLDQAVVKVQVHAGGRGKAGGVRLARNRQEILQAAKDLLGMRIVNNQTGEEGVTAHKVLIGSLTEYRKEFYMGAVVDRQRARAVLMVSPEGGVEIEEVAEKSPERILKIPIPLHGSFKQYTLLKMVKFMGWAGETAKQGMRLAQALAKAFVETDGVLLEINPLVETADGNLVVLDAKLSIDENALYRQQKIASFYDPTQISPIEVEAKKYDLAYVYLGGEVGCMVNGAGLAMATMDLIFLCGGSPANFLDVGGGASEQKVAEGFQLILADPKVRAIFVNIFGGIMDCSTLAAGILSAASKRAIQVPLVVRMEGTNVEEGRRLLAESDLEIVIEEDLTKAAQRVISASRGG